MNGLILWAGQNTIAALILALLVYGVTRVWRHPPTAHLLWLLVLLKLVAPPLWPVSWPTHSSREMAVIAHPSRQSPAGIAKVDSSAGSRDGVADQDVAGDIVADTPADSPPAVPVAAARPIAVEASGATWSLIAQRAVVMLWLAGATVCGLVTAVRIVRFERLLRDTLPASRRCEQLTAEIAARLGIRKVPTVRYVQSADVPLLWCAGLRPTIVLPIDLVNEISEDRLALILAHELAHLRRRDHWVRVVELLVVTLYWWNPLAWIIRRQIHQAEDLCCDAWVRRAFPDQNHRYAEAIFATAEWLRRSRPGRPPQLASPFFHTGTLKARIEMILHSQFAPQLSRKAKWLIALLAMVVIPSAALQARDETPKNTATDSVTTTVSADDVATGVATGFLLAMQSTEQAPPAALEFPHVVPFEQGATRFADGDDIKISEIRGTAATFSPGNIYRIKGTYTLASHDRATLAAYTTARDAKEGTSTSYKVQTTTVDKGTGDFTLYLPMSCQGWPHVSFYPASGGSSFGGNYFGTGDSTLKQWWGTKDSKQTAATSPAAASQGYLTSRAPVKLTFISPQLKSVTLTQQYVAQIHSMRHIKIRSLEKGYLESVAVKEGQQVKAGDTLFEIHPILYQKKVDAEEAERKLTEIKLQSARKLQAQKVINGDEVLQLEAMLMKAKANADLAKAELDFATIKAPFNGMIGRLQVGKGSYVDEGEILTVLSDNSALWVYFNVPESRYLEYMQNQQQEDLKIELQLANGKKFDQAGKIGAIEADFNNETGNIPFRADFPNPDRILRHGQAGTVLISHELNDALVIPQRATFEVLGKRYVYVVDGNDVAQQREIDVLNEVDDVFVVKKGSIEIEDRIILDGVRQVHAGEKVKADVN